MLGLETAKASKDNSTPRFRSFPMFCRLVSTPAGCGTLTESSRSDVFLT
jgi:hypothetical protein